MDNEHIEVLDGVIASLRAKRSRLASLGFNPFYGSSVYDSLTETIDSLEELSSALKG